jgi:hypothetical protein
LKIRCQQTGDWSRDSQQPDALYPEPFDVKADVLFSNKHGLAAALSGAVILL